METEMSNVFNSLKLVTAKRATQLPTIQIRRNKLLAKLTEQIKLAIALKDGNTYLTKRLRNVKDSVSGERKVVEIERQVRPWFFNAESGKVMVQLRYGSKVIQFNAKGDKNAIEVSDSAELLSVLQTLKTAVENGELDQQIGVAADLVKARFGK